MEIKAADVKALRDRTGAGMMDCKKALEACEGNQDKAADWLREKGIAKAEKEGTAVNYAKMEEALSNYANKLYGKFENEKGEAIPAQGEVYGSNEQIDFDIDEYL